MTGAQALAPRAAERVAQLGLQPHPEGGFYAEVHRSAAHVDPRDGRPPRAALTSIYFLLPAGACSRWHRVRSDEVWIHLEGAPLALHALDAATRRVQTLRLGPLDAPGSRPQHTIPAGVWQAAQAVPAAPAASALLAAHGDGGADGYTLVACIVAPGFDFADFALLDADPPLADWLRREQPALAALI